MIKDRRWVGKEKGRKCRRRWRRRGEGEREREEKGEGGEGGGGGEEPHFREVNERRRRVDEVWFVINEGEIREVHAKIRDGREGSGGDGEAEVSKVLIRFKHILQLLPHIPSLLPQHLPCLLQPEYVMELQPRYHFIHHHPPLLVLLPLAIYYHQY